MPTRLPSDTGPAKRADVWSVSEVAAQLRVHRHTIYRAIKSGKLKAQHIGAVIRISNEALADFTAGKSQ